MQRTPSLKPNVAQIGGRCQALPILAQQDFLDATEVAQIADAVRSAWSMAKAVRVR